MASIRNEGRVEQEGRRAVWAWVLQTVDARAWCLAATGAVDEDLVASDPDVVASVERDRARPTPTPREEVPAGDVHGWGRVVEDRRQEVAHVEVTLDALVVRT